MSVELTEGELALTVFISPCTIHGWRPFSVKNQPAVFIRNGVMTAHTPIAKNHFDRASVPLCTSQAPHRANSAISPARYAITRIDQYWMKTLGTYSPGPYLTSYSRCSWFRPTTAPFQVPVARNESRCGISMIWL